MYRRWQHPLHSDVLKQHDPACPNARFYLKLKARVAYWLLLVSTRLFTCQYDRIADLRHLATCDCVFPRYFVKQDKSTDLTFSLRDYIEVFVQVCYVLFNLQVEWKDDTSITHTQII
jgi:hypothetical protein